MTFGQFLSILYARRWVALLVLAIVVAATLVISLILPKQYTAVASVVVDAKPDPLTAMMYPGMSSPAFMATQVDIIQSDRVAQRVVHMLKLADNPQVRQQWMDATGGQGAIEPWLADTFQRNMDVKPSRESNVITISYRAQDPRFAAGLANAFVQSYVDTVLELRVDPAKQYSAFFDTRGKEAREALEKAQTRLSAYQKEKDIVATDERLDVETARLNELSSQLITLQALSAESGSRQSQLRRGSAESMQEVLSNPLISGMKGDVARAEAHLKELNSRLGDSNPQVVEARASLAELRARLDTETRRVMSGVTVSNTITQQRVAETQSALDAQRTKVLRLKAARDGSDILAKDVENAQHAFEAVQARLNQTSLESQTTQSNVNVLTQATPPVEPSSPKIVINTLLAVFVGGMLAVGVALLLEFVDRRVRSIQDLPNMLGLPLIGILPKPNTSRSRGKGGLTLMQQRVMGHLPAPTTKSA
jgi:succinoglycan biosynthesis transport protein ExoP